MNTIDELQKLAAELKSKSGTLVRLNLLKRLEEIEKIALDIGKSWSNSWIGYHSRVYYQDFKAPPLGSVFVVEWGFQKMSLMRSTTGDWKEYQYDDVIKEIYQLADLRSAYAKYMDALNQGLIPVKPQGIIEPNYSAKGIASLPEKMPARQCLERCRNEAKLAGEYFEDLKSQLLSTLEITSQIYQQNDYLKKQRELIENTQVLCQNDFVNAMMPRGQVFTRDQIALQEGLQTPPHISVGAAILAIKHPFMQCGKLGKTAEHIGLHLQDLERKVKRMQKSGTKIFIGHGHSRIWIELKDLLWDRLGLKSDEFERISAAGLATKERLIQMLDQAAFAFLVLTGEDEQIDGEFHARMNVIHEAGLFQGRLGFERAIILLEEGCKDFSNIHGLGHIPFPKGNIKASFEDIRKVLEREGIIPSTSK